VVSTFPLQAFVMKRRSDCRAPPLNGSFRVGRGPICKANPVAACSTRGIFVRHDGSLLTARCLQQRKNQPGVSRHLAQTHVRGLTKHRRGRIFALLTPLRPEICVEFAKTPLD
jgi:hypothetical protein